MRYPLFTYIKDGLEITMSEPTKKGVHVFFERWNSSRNAFDSMDMLLPHGKMEHIVGFSAQEVKRYENMILDLSKFIIETSSEYYKEDQIA